MYHKFRNLIEDTDNEDERIKVTADVSIMENDIGEIFKTLVSLAKRGDTKAAELVFDRTIPKIKPITQRTFVLRHEDYNDLEEWYGNVMFLFIQGVLTFEQAQAQLSLVKDKNKMLLEDLLAFQEINDVSPMVEDSPIH